MHIKFLAHSTGSGQKAVDYLLGELDHTGKVRGEVKVLRGDPALVARQIDSLSTVHRYTSAVIAWGPTDNPSDAEIEAVLDDFERVSFAGLQTQQYMFSAVLHRDEVGVHVHIIVPRCEMITGRSMNIAPPGWKYTYDPLRTYWNRLKGWARPEDPLLLRPVTGSTQKAPVWKKGEDLRQQITWIIEQGVNKGLIFDRADVIETLANFGEITRAGKDYVSVKITGQDKATRLKGAFYVDDFKLSTMSEAARALAARPGGREPADPALAAVALKDVERAFERRRKYNSRYPVLPAQVPTPAQQIKDEHDRDYTSEYHNSEYGDFGLPIAGFDAIREFGAINTLDTVRHLPSSTLDARGQEPKRVLPRYEPAHLDHVITARTDRLRRPRNGKRKRKAEVKANDRDAVRSLAHRIIEQVERATRETSRIVERAIEQVERTTRKNEVTNERFRSAIDVAIRIFDEFKRKIEQFLTGRVPEPAAEPELEAMRVPDQDQEPDQEPTTPKLKLKR